MRRFILNVVLCLGCAFTPCLNVASAASNGSETSSPLDEDRYQAYVDKIAKAETDTAHVMKTPGLPEIKAFQELADAGAAYGVRPRFSDLVIEQYQNPKIRVLLQEMAAREDIPPDVKATIRYIRSGEGFARKRWDDFNRECMRWSEIRSIAACVSLATQILSVYGVSLTW